MAETRSVGRRFSAMWGNKRAMKTTVKMPINNSGITLFRSCRHRLRNPPKWLRVLHRTFVFRIGLVESLNYHLFVHKGRADGDGDAYTRQYRIQDKIAVEILKLPVVCFPTFCLSCERETRSQVILTLTLCFSTAIFEMLSRRSWFPTLFGGRAHSLHSNEDSVLGHSAWVTFDSKI
jgi:hypothetical protein